MVEELELVGVLMLVALEEQKARFRDGERLLPNATLAHDDRRLATFERLDRDRPLLQRVLQRIQKITSRIMLSCRPDYMTPAYTLRQEEPDMTQHETAHRVEQDSMGEVEVPRDALFGAQTRRALDNFPISDLRKPRRFVEALGAIKLEAANVNHELGLLDEEIRDAIVQAAEEVVEGKLDNQFVLDIFQTGSGTSTNMNANEVISNRAIQLLGGELGSKSPAHPNDHVNQGQSSNDVIPTAIHISALVAIKEDLLPGLRKLQEALDVKASEFDDVVKTGRTHLQDAT